MVVPQLVPVPARAPLFWAAIAFAIGICIGRYAWRPPAWWIVAALSFALATLYFRSRRTSLSLPLCLAAFAFTGALAAQIARGPSQQVFGVGSSEAVSVTAHVISEGELQRENVNTFHRAIDVETEAIQAGTAIHDARFGVRLNIYAKDQSLETDNPDGNEPDRVADLHYGQRVRFRATLNLPRNFRNPGAFDYAAYLRDEGIAATASVKSNEVELLPGFSGNRLTFWLARTRQSILSRIHKIWPAQQAALLDAMLLGEKAFVERPDRVEFQRSGTYHMLIVAGLHVGIIAFCAIRFLRRLHIGDFGASVVTIILISIYAALTREGSPVWRAALMIDVYLAARFLYRRRAALNGLGVAAIALLVLNPNALFGASFQMSFLCVALIAGVAVPFLENTIQPYAHGLRNLDAIAWDRSLPPGVAQFRLDLRLVLSHLTDVNKRKWVRRVLVFTLRVAFRVAELVVVSAVMQFGMALPMAYYFHRVTAVATFANLFTVPFLNLLMPAAAAAIATSYLSLRLARIPAAIAAIALQDIAGTVRWLGGLRIADVRLPVPSVAVLICSSLAIFAAVAAFRRPRPYSFTAVGMLLLSAFCVWDLRPHPRTASGVLELTAIDVGQGDSLLLVLPDGHKLLVDAGGLPFWTHSQTDIGEDVVSPYLWSRGISRVDAIALTHAHADHMGGFPAIIANFHPGELWLPEGIGNDEIGPLLEAAARFGVKLVHHQAGDMIAYGGAQIKVLAPDPRFPVRVAHRNDESLVMKITYGRTSALLEADAERGTEGLVASEHPEADVLKVAHHGSATSTQPELIEAVHPKFAVISVGYRNVYHHPRPEVLRRLQQSKVTAYRTDLDGATSFYLDGNSVTSQVTLAH